MTITASQVKELREKTGVGMMECKKALQENNGDLEQAILWLRERGMSRAQKKADRITAEGLVEVYVPEDHSAGVLLELNCETDFVSKNEDFRKFANDVAKLALANKAKTIEELESAKFGSSTVKDTLTEMIARIGENMNLRRVTVLTPNNGTVSGYSHMNGKIGTLVALEGAKGDKVAELAKDLAMHVAAAAPRYLNESEVSQEELKQEEDLARKALEEEGKPADLIDKIMVGQMKKFFKEVCFIDQAYIKDPNQSVSKVVEASKLGAKIAGFSRFALGEGIEKKKENFAEEVAAAANLNK